MKPLSTVSNQLDNGLPIWPDLNENVTDLSAGVCDRARVVIEIPPVLDRKQAKRLCRQIRALPFSNQQAMVLDMSGVRQINPAGIRILLQCLSQAYRHDAPIKLIGISPEAETLLELLGLERAFGVVASSNSRTSDAEDLGVNVNITQNVTDYATENAA